MNVNVLKTNEKLQKDDNLREVIEALGFNHVRDRGDYYQFPNLDGDNRSAISVYKQSLHYVNYTRNDSGSIYNLIMFVKKCSFPTLQGQTLHARTLGIIHPRTGEHLEVNAPLPDYFEELLESLRKIKN